MSNVQGNGNRNDNPPQGMDGVTDQAVPSGNADTVRTIIDESPLVPSIDTSGGGDQGSSSIFSSSSTSSRISNVNASTARTTGTDLNVTLPLFPDVPGLPLLHSVLSLGTQVFTDTQSISNALRSFEEFDHHNQLYSIKTRSTTHQHPRYHNNNHHNNNGGGDPRFVNNVAAYCRLITAAMNIYCSSQAEIGRGWVLFGLILVHRMTRYLPYLADSKTAEQPVFKLVDDMADHLNAFYGGETGMEPGSPESYLAMISAAKFVNSLQTNRRFIDVLVETTSLICWSPTATRPWGPLQSNAAWGLFYLRCIIIHDIARKLAHMNQAHIIGSNIVGGSPFPSHAREHLLEMSPVSNNRPWYSRFQSLRPLDNRPCPVNFTDMIVAMCEGSNWKVSSHAFDIGLALTNDWVKNKIDTTNIGSNNSSTWNKLLFRGPNSNVADSLTVLQSAEIAHNAFLAFLTSPGAVQILLGNTESGERAANAIVSYALTSPGAAKIIAQLTEKLHTVYSQHVSGNELFHRVIVPIFDQFLAHALPSSTTGGGAYGTPGTTNLSRSTVLLNQNHFYNNSNIITRSSEASFALVDGFRSGFTTQELANIFQNRFEDRLPAITSLVIQLPAQNFIDTAILLLSKENVDVYGLLLRYMTAWAGKVWTNARGKGGDVAVEVWQPKLADELVQFFEYATPLLSTLAVQAINRANSNGNNNIAPYTIVVQPLLNFIVGTASTALKTAQYGATIGRPESLILFRIIATVLSVPLRSVRFAELADTFIPDGNNQNTGIYLWNDKEVTNMVLGTFTRDPLVSIIQQSCIGDRAQALSAGFCMILQTYESTKALEIMNNNGNPKNRSVSSELPRMYVTIASAYGQAVTQQALAVTYASGRGNEANIQIIAAAATDIIPHDARPLTLPAVAFGTATLQNVAEYLSTARFRPPQSLARLARMIEFFRGNPQTNRTLAALHALYTHPDNGYAKSLISIIETIENTVISAIVALSEGDLTREELDMLTGGRNTGNLTNPNGSAASSGNKGTVTNINPSNQGPSISNMIETLRDVAEALGANTEAMQPLSEERILSLLAQFETAERKNNELIGILSFLGPRHLLVPDVLTTRPVAPNELPQARLRDLEHRYTTIQKEFGLLGNTFRALSAFARDSKLFANRFDLQLVTVRLRMDTPDPNKVDRLTLNKLYGDIIVECTEAAVEYLNNSFFSPDATIENFITDLGTALEDLRRHGNSVIGKELDMIRMYFQMSRSRQNPNSRHEIDVKDRIACLDAAIVIMRYREELTGFVMTARDYGLMNENMIATIQQSPALAALMGLVKLGQAQTVLRDIRQLLGGLSSYHIATLSMLRTGSLPGFYAWLKREDVQGTYFARNIDLARQRASANEHALTVIARIEGIRTLLQPIYSGKIKDLNGLAVHMNKCMGTEDKDNIPPIMADLRVIAEQWPAVEPYFNGDASTVSAQRILQFAETFIASGRFFSSLSGHQGGAALSFRYRMLDNDKSNKRRSTTKSKTTTATTEGIEYPLDPQLLQEHIQAALLSMSRAEDDTQREALQGFVAAYREAEACQRVRLLLEAASHPDHQSDFEPVPLAATADVNDLADTRTDLENQLLRWTVNLQNAIVRVPRLSLLSSVSLLAFIDILRNANTTGNSHIVSFRADGIPLLVQIFPDLLDQRTILTKTFNDILTPGPAKPNLFTTVPTNADAALDKLCELVLAIAKRLNVSNGDGKTIRDEDEEVDSDEEEEETIASGTISVIDMDGSTPSSVYRSALAILRHANSTGPLAPVPGQILWGRKDTTIREVTSWLQRAHSVRKIMLIAVDVNYMSSTVREALLQGLLSPQELCSDITLLFSSGRGRQPFLALPSGTPVDIPTREQLRQLFWSLPASGDSIKPPKDSVRPFKQVTVVAGASGVGKSRWITQELQAIQPNVISITAHEGFSVTVFIKRYRTLLEKLTKMDWPQAAVDFTGPNNTRPSIGFHLRVTAYADLPMLASFFHSLLACGLIIDTVQGTAVQLHTSIDHRLFVELPSLTDAEYSRIIEVTTGVSGTMMKETVGSLPNSNVNGPTTLQPNGVPNANGSWPVDPMNPRGHEHPILERLGPLAVGYTQLHNVTPGNFPFIIDEQSALVAAYINLYTTAINTNSDAATALDNSTLPLVRPASLTDDVARNHLETLWRNEGIPINKRSQATHLRLLIDRLPYLAKIQQEYQRQKTSRDVRALSGWIDRNAFGNTTYGGSSYVPQFYSKMMKLMVREATHIVRSSFTAENTATTTTLVSSTTIANPYSVWSVRPTDPNGYDILVSVNALESNMNATTNTATVAWEDYAERFPGAKKLYPNMEQDQMKYIRSSIAPAFGVSDSSVLLDLLRDNKFVLTSDSVIRLLELHGRREARLPLVLEGDTGVGKSELLRLYSTIINADSDVFCNLKVELVNVLRAAAEAFCDRDAYIPLLAGGSNAVKKYRAVRTAATNTANVNSTRVALDINASMTADVIIGKAVEVVRHNHNGEDSDTSAEKLANQLGSAIVAYFNQLFYRYPLLEQGISPVVRTILERYRRLPLNGLQRQVAESIATTARTFSVVYNTNNTTPSNSTTVQGAFNPLYKVDHEPDAIEALNDDSTVNLEGVDVTDDDTTDDDVETEGTTVPPRKSGTTSNVKSSSSSSSTAASNIGTSSTAASNLMSLGDTIEEDEDTGKPFGSATRKPRGIMNNIGSNRYLFIGEEDFRAFLTSLLETRPAALYHRLLMHEGFTAAKWREEMLRISDQAKNIKYLVTQPVISIDNTNPFSVPLQGNGAIPNTADSQAFFERKYVQRLAKAKSLRDSLATISSETEKQKVLAKIQEAEISAADAKRFANRIATNIAIMSTSNTTASTTTNTGGTTTNLPPPPPPIPGTGPVRTVSMRGPRKVPTICIFVDELNTAGALGCITEALTDHTLDGRPLPDNIFFVGAINPWKPDTSGNASTNMMDFTRVERIDNAATTANTNRNGSTTTTGSNIGRTTNPSSARKPFGAAADEDEAVDYLEGAPFIVRPLPASLQRLVVPFSPLNEASEKAFLTIFLTEQLDISRSDVTVLVPTGEMPELPQHHMAEEEDADLAYARALAEQEGVLPNRNNQGYHNESESMLIQIWPDLMESLRKEACTVILAAQRLVRSYNIPRVHVSIRDLLRAAYLFRWLLIQRTATEIHPVTGDPIPESEINPFLPQYTDAAYVNRHDKLGVLRERIHHALYIAVGLTYWFRLPSEGHVLAKKATRDLRKQFITDLVRETKGLNDVAFLPTYVVGGVNHLWNHARIPSSVAHVPSLQEAFYCSVLSIQSGTPLLVTGPPGCGKTLSFLLASDNLRSGHGAATPVFQALRAARLHNYQCSEASTATAIEALYDGARKAAERSDPTKEVHVVFMDEAGLPRERRQALKATHDVLDAAGRRGGVSTVMLSNTTLDAAKTSRMLQLLQGSANAQDTERLAAGLLLDPQEAIMIGLGPPNSMVKRNMDNDVAGLERLAEVRKRIEGLFLGFAESNDYCFMPVGVRGIFHSRDFTYLLRFLRKECDIAGLRGSFDANMLIRGLRRNFNGIPAPNFSRMTRRFLELCGFIHRNDTSIPFDTSPAVLTSLREAIHAVGDTSNPSDDPFRHVLLIDQTDSGAGLDLLVSAGIILRENLTVVSLSDFPEDTTSTTHSEALARVKEAVERGNTLLLCNPLPLATALYDLFNKRYISSGQGTENVRHFANLSLGAHTWPTRVHPDFRVIVHLPAAQLPHTPLPFLNRFSKFTISVTTILEGRFEELTVRPPPCLSMLSTGHRQQFLRHLWRGVEHFAAFMAHPDIAAALKQVIQNEKHPGAGTAPTITRSTIEVSALYGFAPGDTIAAIVLRVLEDISNHSSPVFTIRPPFRIASRSTSSSLTESSPDSSDTEGGNTTGNDGSMGDNSSSNSTNNSGNDGLASDPLLRQLPDFIAKLNLQLIQLMRPEEVFERRYMLPQKYIEEYVVHQEHYSAANLCRSLLMSPEKKRPKERSTDTSEISRTDSNGSTSSVTDSETNRLGTGTPSRNSIGNKLVVYTRTSGSMLRLSLDQSFAKSVLGVPVTILKDSSVYLTTGIVRTGNNGKSVVSNIGATSNAKGSSSSTTKNVVELDFNAQIEMALKASREDNTVIRKGKYVELGSNRSNISSTTKLSLTNKRESVKNPGASILSLGTCVSFADCESRLRSWLKPFLTLRPAHVASRNTSDAELLRPTSLLVIADMSICTASMVTAARQAIDRILEQTVAAVSANGSLPLWVPPHVIFLLHVSPELLHMNPCYPAVPHAGWDFLYVDSLGVDDVDTSVTVDDGANEDTVLIAENDDDNDDNDNDDSDSDNEAKKRVSLASSNREDARRWLSIAYGLSGSIEDLVRGTEFEGAVLSALEDAVGRLRFPQQGVMGNKIPRALGLAKSLTPYMVMTSPAVAVNWVKGQLNRRAWLRNVLLESFRAYWVTLLQDTAVRACARVRHGGSTGGLLEAFRRSQEWLFGDFLAHRIALLAEDWGLESIANSAEGALPDPNTDSPNTIPLPIVHARLCQAILRTLPPPHPEDIPGQSKYAETIRVRCVVNGSRAALTPLFSSLNQLLHNLHADIVNATQEGTYNNIAGTDSTDGNPVVSLGGTVSPGTGQAIAALLALPKNRLLINCLQCICSQRDAWVSWLSDYLRITLSFIQLKDDTLTAAIAVAEDVLLSSTGINFDEDDLLMLPNGSTTQINSPYQYLPVLAYFVQEPIRIAVSRLVTVMMPYSSIYEDGAIVKILQPVPATNGTEAVPQPYHGKLLLPVPDSFLCAQLVRLGNQTLWKRFQDLVTKSNTQNGTKGKIAGDDEFHELLDPWIGAMRDALAAKLVPLTPDTVNQRITIIPANVSTTENNDPNEEFIFDASAPTSTTEALQRAIMMVTFSALGYSQNHACASILKSLYPLTNWVPAPTPGTDNEAMIPSVLGLTISGTLLSLLNHYLVLENTLKFDNSMLQDFLNRTLLIVSNNFVDSGYGNFVLLSLLGVPPSGKFTYDGKSYDFRTFGTRIAGINLRQRGIYISKLLKMAGTDALINSMLTNGVTKPTNPPASAILPYLYIPSIVESATVNEIPGAGDANAVTNANALIPPSLVLNGNGKTMAELLFGISIELNNEKARVKDGNLPIGVAVQQFLEIMSTTKTLIQQNSTQYSPLLAIRIAATTVQLLDTVADALSIREGNAIVDFLAKPQFVEAVLSAMNLGRAKFGAYLLSRIRGQSIASVIGNEALLKAIGMPGWYFETQTDESTRTLAYFPLQLRSNDPLYAVYNEASQLVSNENLTLANICQWTTAQNAKGTDAVWRARGILILAVYYKCWIRNRSCPALADWANKCSTNHASVPENARLNLGSAYADESAPYVFLAKGPQPYIYSTCGREAGFPYLFSLECLQFPTKSVREDAAAERSVWIGELAVLMGSPRDRVYYRKPLFDPASMAPARNAVGFGSGHGHLAKDCGLQLDVRGQFIDVSPVARPFNNERNCRLMNNALITGAWAWNTVLFPTRHGLLSPLFSFVDRDDEYNFGAKAPRFDHTTHKGAAHALYSYMRARTFFDYFHGTFRDGEPLLAWGGALQYMWDAILNRTQNPRLKETYENNPAELEAAMGCLGTAWKKGFGEEVRLREAHRQALGEGLRRRLTLLEKARKLSMRTVNPFSRPTPDDFRQALEKLVPPPPPERPHNTNDDDDDDAPPSVALTVPKAAASLLLDLYVNKLDSLHLGKYTLAISAMYSFMASNFAYRLTEEQARSMSLIDAIMDLPSSSVRNLGRKLYKEFIFAWKQLQEGFQTYEVCGNEMQAAAPIPAFNDANPIKVSDVITMPGFDIPGAEEYEALMRMLDQRLVRQQSHTLSNGGLIKLRGASSSEGTPDSVPFNRHCWLIEEDAQTLDLAAVPPTAVNLLLSGLRVTGTDTHSNNHRSVRSYDPWELVAGYAQYTPPPPPPPPVSNVGGMTNNANSNVAPPPDEATATGTWTFDLLSLARYVLTTVLVGKPNLETKALRRRFRFRQTVTGKPTTGGGGGGGDSHQPSVDTESDFIIDETSLRLRETSVRLYSILHQRLTEAALAANAKPVVNLLKLRNIATAPSRPDPREVTVISNKIATEMKLSKDEEVFALAALSRQNENTLRALGQQLTNILVRGIGLLPSQLTDKSYNLHRLVMEEEESGLRRSVRNSTVPTATNGKTVPSSTVSVSQANALLKQSFGKLPLIKLSALAELVADAGSGRAYGSRPTLNVRLPLTVEKALWNQLQFLSNLDGESQHEIQNILRQFSTALQNGVDILESTTEEARRIDNTQSSSSTVNETFLLRNIMKKVITRRSTKGSVTGTISASSTETNTLLTMLNHNIIGFILSLDICVYHYGPLMRYLRAAIARLTAPLPQSVTTDDSDDYPVNDKKNDEEDDIVGSSSSNAASSSSSSSMRTKMVRLKNKLTTVVTEQSKYIELALTAWTETVSSNANVRPNDPKPSIILKAPIKVNPINPIILTNPNGGGSSSNSSSSSSSTGSNINRPNLVVPVTPVRPPLNSSFNIGTGTPSSSRSATPNISQTAVSSSSTSLKSPASISGTDRPRTPPRVSPVAVYGNSSSSSSSFSSSSSSSSSSSVESGLFGPMSTGNKLVSSNSSGTFTNVMSSTQSSPSVNSSQSATNMEDDDEETNLRPRTNKLASRLSEMSSIAAQNRVIDPAVLVKDEGISMDDIQYLVSRGIIELRKIPALGGAERIPGTLWDNLFNKLIDIDQEAQYLVTEALRICRAELQPQVLATFPSVINNALDQALRSDTNGAVRVFSIRNKRYAILEDLARWQTRMGNNVVLLIRTNVRTGLTASFQSIKTAASTLKFANPEDFIYCIDSGAIEEDKMGRVNKGILTCLVFIDGLATLEEILTLLDDETTHMFIESLGLGNALVDGSARNLVNDIGVRILRWRNEEVIVLKFLLSSAVGGNH